MSKRVMIAVIGVFVILGVAKLHPLFMPARTTYGLNACVNNLRQIQGVQDQWALENHKTTNDTPT